MAAVLWDGRVCAADNSTVEDFIRSCYTLPYDARAEMTDVLLVDGYYTDEVQINKMITEVFREFDSTNYHGQDVLLKSLFQMPLMNQNAIIKFERERCAAGFYRIDSDITNLPTFDNFAWEGGAFTNSHPLRLVKLSIPPHETNLLWTCYTMQPFASRITVEEGAHPLLINEGMYLQLFSLPPSMLLNVILQTADRKMLPNRDFGQDPSWFSAFTLSKDREKAFIGGVAGNGKWVASDFRGKKTDLKQMNFVGADGVDRNSMKVFYNGVNPHQRYLAYVRERTGNCSALFAWDYNNEGTPVRFLKVESGFRGMQAYARNIIYLSKTNKVDSSLATVDINQYYEVYDRRPEFPVEYMGGKIVFDARKDKYATVAGLRKQRLSFLTKQALVRCVVLCAFLLPLALAFFYRAKLGHAKSSDESTRF